MPPQVQVTVVPETQRQGLDWEFHCILSIATWGHLSLTHVCLFLIQNIVSKAHQQNVTPYCWRSWSKELWKSSEKEKAPWPLVWTLRENSARVQAGASDVSIFPLRLSFSCLMSASCSFCPYSSGTLCLSYPLCLYHFQLVAYLSPECSTISVCFVIDYAS